MRAHVILPLHREIDRLRELGKGAIGTTKRGIGPAYESKMARRGLRMSDLLDAKRFAERYAYVVEEIGPYVRERGGELPPESQVVDEHMAYGERLRKYLMDASRFVHDEMKRGRDVLFEGAQGALLDIDHGTYPFVTSSNTIAGAACTSCGVGPTSITAAVGIAKAYTTRVGGGPFPTELTDALGETIRKVGQEFGATTGRPRRCGWLDVAALRLAVRLSGLSSLALTKLDVLAGINPLKICTGYKVRGELRDELPTDPEDITNAEPVYEEIEGWSEDIRNVREVEALPMTTRRYIKRIEALLDIDVAMISVGPGRAETIMTKNPFR